MKKRRKTTLRLGLACSLIAFTAQASAKKPVKPPPPPPDPPGVTFTMLNAGSFGDEDDLFYAAAINDHGAIVGTFTPREFWGNDPHYGPIYSYGSDNAFLLEPVDGVYFQDADGDGANDLVQFLPRSPDGASASDINKLGQIAGNQVADGHGVGTVWDGTEIAFEMPGTELIAINNAGAVVGILGRPQPDDTVHATTFVIVPEDENLDGRPDSWFSDADGDGVNDLFHVVHEVVVGADPIGVFDDLSVLCRDFIYVSNPEDPREEWVWLGNPTPSVVRPDFTDADGDGNPWYSDVDGDHLNDLIENFSARATVSSVSGGGLAVGSVDRDVGLFDANTVSWIDLDWVDPNAKPGGGRASATAVNDAAWIIGDVTDRKGNTTSVFWRDGELWKFGAIAPVSFRLTDINQAGVIVGDSQSTGILVALPSVSP